MFCKDCGTQLENDVRFCPNCGSAQAVTPLVQPVQSPVTSTDPRVNFADKVRTTAKKVGSSPLFLIATLFVTLLQVLGVMSLFNSNLLFDPDLFSELQLNTQEILTAANNTYLVSGLIGMIPGILITIGLWITYGSCIRRKPTVNTSGLTLIFGVNLVQLVLFSLLFLFALVLVGIFYFNADALFGADAELVQVVLLITGFILLAGFVLLLIYAIKICTTISNVRSTLQTGVPDRRASRFVGVMCFISSVLIIPTGLEYLLNSGVATLDSYYDDAFFYLPPSTLFLSGISILLTAVVQILFGVIIFSYRGKMQALEAEGRLNTFKTLSHAEPYTSPVYIPPQPAAAPEIVEESAAPEEMLAPVEDFEPEDLAEPEEITEPATEEETD